jgi:sulfonate transport system substrate-binding protein
MNRFIRNTLTTAVAGLALVASAGQALAQDLKEVRISSQPALLGSVPFLLAEEKGWWKELGLKVTITNFPAGAPQVAASKSWDVGYTGAVPAVLGAVRFNLHTVAFSDDQSATNGLYVRGPNADALIKNPASLKGGTVFLTGNSTVDLAARMCMQKFGLVKGDVTVRSMGQAEIIAAMSSGSADVGGLWAPNTYTVEEKAGGKPLCSGKGCGRGHPRQHRRARRMGQRKPTTGGALPGGVPARTACLGGQPQRRRGGDEATLRRRRREHFRQRHEQGI